MRNRNDSAAILAAILAAIFAAIIHYGERSVVSWDQFKYRLSVALTHYIAVMQRVERICS